MKVYSITFVKKPGPDRVEPYGGKLPAAKELAQQAIADGIAERVEVRDELGRMLLSLPRTVSAA